MDRIAELEQQLRSSEERETHLLHLSQSLRLKVKETEQWLSASQQHSDQEPASHTGQKNNTPSLRTSYAGDGKNSIALCISGQVGRTQPDNTFKRLIQTNPEFSFTLFFNLQSGTAFYATADTVGTTKPKERTIAALNEKLEGWKQLASNWNLAGIQEHPFLDRQWLLKNLSLPVLDRIEQYKHIEERIINMMLKDVACAEQISTYEDFYQTKFDYVASTREDAYFFTPFDLPKALRHLTGPKKCQLISKECLAWGGINMRFSLMRREVADRWLGERVWFYRSMFKHRSSVWNPEQMYLMQVNVMRITHCPVPVEDLPVGAARYKTETEHCLILPEFTDTEYSCVPQNADPFPICSNRGSPLTYVKAPSKYAIMDTVA